MIEFEADEDDVVEDEADENFIERRLFSEFRENLELVVCVIVAALFAAVSELFDDAFECNETVI